MRPLKTKLNYAVTCPSPVKSRLCSALHPAGVFVELNWTSVEGEESSDHCRISLPCCCALWLLPLAASPSVFPSLGERDELGVGRSLVSLTSPFHWAVLGLFKQLLRFRSYREDKDGT